MIYTIRHSTIYDYNDPISQCYNIAHVLPRDTARQSCLWTQLEINPQPNSHTARVDYFGNNCNHFNIEYSHKRLEVTARSRVKVAPPIQSLNLDFGVTCAQARENMNRSSEDMLDALEFLYPSTLVPPLEEVKAYAAESFAPGRPLLSAVEELNQRIYTDFKYDPDATEVSTPLQTVMNERHGVCQDFAHLGVACLRSQGFAARYISGYLETLPPPGKEKLVGSDATHAWFAVYSPGEGWFEFDPTNNITAGEQHITTAWGRDYSDVTPLQGVVFGAGKQQLTVQVDVLRTG